MNRETSLDGGHLPADLSASGSEAEKARTAFANEYHDSKPVGFKLGAMVETAVQEILHILPLPHWHHDSSAHASHDSSSPAPHDSSTGGRSHSSVAPGPESAAGANPAAAQLGHDLEGRIAKTVGLNEGDVTHITPNDAGHGISCGIRQWNQKRGELPDLFQSMHSCDPRKFENTFGGYSQSMLQEKWVRHSNLAGDHDFMQRLTKALHDPVFQKLQLEKAREFAHKSIDLARQLGLKTEQGAALVADVVNQMGENGATQVFEKAGVSPNHSARDEKTILNRAEHLTHRPNSKSRFDVVVSSFDDGVLIDKNNAGQKRPI